MIFGEQYQVSCELDLIKKFCNIKQYMLQLHCDNNLILNKYKICKYLQKIQKRF